jgi:hypothetical protein
MRYLVQDQDRFSQVATRFGLTPQELLARNPSVPVGRTLSGAPCVHESAWNTKLVLDVGPGRRTLGDDQTSADDTDAKPCGPGTTDDGTGTGTCRPVVASDCDPGDTFDPNGKDGWRCFGPCPGAGSIYDLSVHQCVCKPGTGWSEKDNACVPGGGEKPPVTTHKGGEAEDAKDKGMSTNTKIAIGVGAAGVLGLGGWLLLRKKRGKK